MDKAIKCLEKFGKVSRASIKLSSEIEDAISELQAHKAKIDEIATDRLNKPNEDATTRTKLIQVLKGLDK